MTKKKYCLEKGQLQNIVSAARDEPGSCTTAKEFIEKDLEMPELTAQNMRKKGGWPKGKKKKGPLTAYELGANEVIRRAQSKAKNVIDYLFGVQ